MYIASIFRSGYQNKTEITILAAYDDELPIFFGKKKRSFIFRKKCV